MENQLKRKVAEIIEGLKYEITYVTWYGDIKLYIYREDYFGNIPMKTRIKGLTKIDENFIGCSIDIDMTLIHSMKDFKSAIEFTIKELVRKLTNEKYGVRL